MSNGQTTAHVKLHYEISRLFLVRIGEGVLRRPSPHIGTNAVHDSRLGIGRMHGLEIGAVHPTGEYLDVTTPY